jgi:hypothetical protein
VDEDFDVDEEEDDNAGVEALSDDEEAVHVSSQ